MDSRKLYAGLLAVVAALFVLACAKPAATEEAKAPSMDHINMMIKDWERAKKFTQAYLDSSNDKMVMYKLSEKTPRSFGEQLLHLAEANYGLGKAGTGKPNDVAWGSLEKNPDIKTKADLTKAVIASYDYVIEGLKGMNDKQLMDTCSIQLGPNFKPTMMKGEMINKLFEHQTHHRGQATQYLRAAGLTPPQEMLF